MYNKYNIDRGLVFSAVFFALGIFLADLNLMLSLTVLVIGLIGAVIAKKKRWLIYGGVFAMAVIMIWWMMLPQALLDKYQGEVGVYGEVIAESRSGYYTVIELEGIDKNILPIKTKVAVSKSYKDDKQYPLGAKVYFSGEFYSPSGRTNPGGFSAENYWHSQGVFRLFDADGAGMVLEAPNLGHKAVGALRLKLDAVLADNLSEESYRLAQGLLFGDKAALDDNFYALSQKMGIAHVFAVSGLHVGLLISFILLVFRLFKKDNSWFCFAVLCITVLFYCALSNFTVSANRAAIMALLAFLARKRLRFKDFYSIFAIAVLVTLAANPYALYAVGAQLSFGVTWSLVFFTPLFQKLFAPLKIKKLIDALAVVFAAQVVSIPLCAWHFYNISLFSPLFNFLIVPIVGIIVPLILLSLVLAVTVPPLSKIFFALSTLLLEGVEKFLNYFAYAFGTGHHYIGQASLIVLVLFVLIFVLWRLDLERQPKIWHSCGFLATAVLLLVIIVLPPKAMDRITFLDVGQGSGAVVETTERDCLIFDCGRSKDTVASYLRYRGINKVEAIILSHADSDHIGGLANILRDFEVERVIAAAETWNDETLTALKAEGAFDNTQAVIAPMGEMDFGKLKLELWPFADSQDLFALLEFNGVSTAFTGDMTKDEQMVIVLANPKIDIFAVPHHGSKNNLVYGLYKRLGVDLAVISVGRYNYYGHPNYAVLEELRKNAVATERTDYAGAVMIYPAEGKFTTKNFLP